MECEFVIIVERVERKRGPRLLERCWVPSDTQELTVVFNPSRAFRARTELNLDAVDPVAMHDNKGLSPIRRRTRSVFVTGKEAITQSSEG